MTPTKIILGGTAIFALLFTFAIQRIPAADPIEIKTQDRWDDAWNDAFEPLRSVALKKADKERIASAEPKPVVVERVLTDAPADVPPVLVMSDLDKPAARRGRHVDVCTRHRMHKVVTRNGRSWRCRR